MTALGADSLVPVSPASTPAAAGGELSVSSQVDDPQTLQPKMQAGGVEEEAADIILAVSPMKRLAVRRHG